MPYFYVDTETCPIDREEYLSRTEAERKKLLNPIDSKIIAIGAKCGEEKTLILQSSDERQILLSFWKEILSFKKSSLDKIVGFNIKDFDLPFIVTRSFIHGVPIVPFTLKDIVDLRELLSAFKYGPTRGKLKEFAQLIGMQIIDDMDGEKVPAAHWAGETQKIKEYLEKDLEITHAIHKRTIELRINEIQRW